MKKLVIKIVTMILCSVAVLGFAIYEAYSIIDKEHTRQLGVAEEAKADINLGLDMIKVAVQTEDTEMYVDNLRKVENGVAVIWPLGLVRSEYGEYLAQLGGYIGVLEERSGQLEEMKGLKEDVSKITGKFKDRYGDKGAITREKVKEAKEKTLGLRIDVEKYKVESVKNAASAVNEMLEKMAGKVRELADCIDNCYEEKIKEIDDRLAEVYKEFHDKTAELNIGLEQGFELNEMAEIREKWGS